MILSKDAFEQALQQDRDQTVLTTDTNAKQDKKGLFGPQTDLAGMPVTSAQQPGAAEIGGPTKEKTRRELMWEQRMQAK